MSDTQKWYIVKKNDGSCDLSDRQPAAGEEKEIWDPFGDRQSCRFNSCRQVQAKIIGRRSQKISR